MRLRDFSREPNSLDRAARFNQSVCSTVIRGTLAFNTLNKPIRNKRRKENEMQGQKFQKASRGTSFHRFGHSILFIAILALGGFFMTGQIDSAWSAEKEPIKVGILHSLSGTMSISEVAVKDGELLAIEEINARGGVLGRTIVPIIEDGASDWPTFAEKAK